MRSAIVRRLPASVLSIISFLLLSTSLSTPLSAASWTSIGPRGAASVDALAFAPSAPNVVYAGLGGGGVARSVDGGKTWTRASHGLLDSVVRALAVDPRNPNTVYAVTPRGLSRSRDGGRSWLNAWPTNIWDGDWFLTVAAGGSSVYVGTRNGMFRSSDGGLHWVPIGQGIAPGEPRFFVPSIVSVPARPGLLYSVYWGAHSGIFASSNGGLRWWRIYSGDVLYVAADPRRPETVFAVSGIYDRTQIARTTDGGRTWSRTHLPAEVFSVVVDPFDSRQVYAATAAGLGKSGDGGAHWAAAEGLAASRVAALALDPAHRGTLLFGATGEGIWRSEDGAAHWLPSSAGLVSSSAWALAVAPDTGRIYASTGSQVVHTDDRGASWAAGAPLPGVGTLAIDPTDPATLYAGTAGPDYVYKTTDGGATWAPAGSGITRGPIVSLAIDPSDPQTLYAGAWDLWTELWDSSPGVFKSTDGGATWSLLSLHSGAAGLAVDPRDPATVYATQLRSVFRSRDGGETWSQAMNGDVPTLRARLLFGLALAPSRPAVLAAFDDRRVFVSRDAGRHWTRVTGVGFAPFYAAAAFDPRDADRLFLGGADGVQRLDGSLELRPEDGDLFNLAVTGIAFDPTSPDTLYVSTAGGGILEADLSR